MRKWLVGACSALGLLCSCGARTGVERFDVKKGIAASPLSISRGSWGEARMQRALTDLDPVWWYNYRFTAEGMRTPGFVPMFTRPEQVTPENVSEAVAEASLGWIAFLNEPEAVVSEVDAAVAWEALANHPDVVAGEIKLLSPATASDGSVADSWHMKWFALIHRLPDAINVHSYGRSASDTELQSARTLARISAYESAYPGYAFWLTEFDLNDGVGGYMLDEHVKAYMRSTCVRLEQDRRVHRYAWWYLGPATTPQSAKFPNSNLYDDSGRVTPIGAEYRDYCGVHASTSSERAATVP